MLYEIFSDFFRVGVGVSLMVKRGQNGIKILPVFRLEGVDAQPFKGVGQKGDLLNVKSPAVRQLSVFPKSALKMDIVIIGTVAFFKPLLPMSRKLNIIFSRFQLDGNAVLFKAQNSFVHEDQHIF